MNIPKRMYIACSYGLTILTPFTMITTAAMMASINNPRISTANAMITFS